MGVCMHFSIRLTLACACAGIAFYAQAAADKGDIRVNIDGVEHEKPIPVAQALCTPTADGKSNKVATPLRPTMRWSGVPKDAATLAVFMMDPDVPADFTDAGKEGKILPSDAKRQDFFHYGLVNLPASVTSIAGAESRDTPRTGTELVNDLGINGYISPKTAYGGPCPPWNDARVHHYHFIVLALDKDAPIAAPAAKECATPSCQPDTAKNTFNRLISSPHVLAKGVTIGTYTLNPNSSGAAK
jgi:phosphatidylethanolamine-binding protein (PEBP) family uncharacterized protein